MADEFIKHSDGVLDYIFDWTDWLESVGDTISTATFAVLPSGLTLGANSHDGETATTWVSGGTNQGSYKIFCKIVTTGGRTETKHITVRIRNEQ